MALVNFVGYARPVGIRGSGSHSRVGVPFASGLAAPIPVTSRVAR